jgi:hypothetical protein
MAEFDIVFEKLSELLEDSSDPVGDTTLPVPDELDEIDELRRFAAELKDVDPIAYTTT